MAPSAASGCREGPYPVAVACLGWIIFESESRAALFPWCRVTIAAWQRRNM